MDARELKGLAVVTLAEAERLGRVDDVMFDTAPLRASALRLKTDTGEQLIALSDVKSIGPDAIVADDREAVRRTDAEAARRRLSGLDALARLKVVDQKGRFLGQIVRVDVDATTGSVSKVDIRKGDLLGLSGETTTLTPDQIISVGPDLLTVRRDG